MRAVDMYLLVGSSGPGAACLPACHNAYPLCVSKSAAPPRQRGLLSALSAEHSSVVGCRRAGSSAARRFRIHCSRHEAVGVV